MVSVGSTASGVVQGGRTSLEHRGDQLMFYVKALAWAPRAIRRYPREIVNTLYHDCARWRCSRGRHRCHAISILYTIQTP